jgi:hypothetical protein
MMKLFLFAALFFVSFQAGAAGDWGVLFQAGADVRFERDEDQMIRNRTLFNFSGGVVRENWIGEVEYASFSTSSGNASLSVDRRFESVLTWLYWQALDFDSLAPYLGGGIGAIRETVKTTLLGMTEADESPWSFTTAAALGVRLFPRSNFWLSGEGRLYKNPRLDPDPEFGAIFRVGWVFF